MKKSMVLLVITIITNLSVLGQTMDHSKWTDFLQKHVTKEGVVDYKSIQANPAELHSYLNQFIDIAPLDSWSKNETLAYCINAYNAFTIKLIIDNYPVKSIKDIKNPWDQKFITINNERISLNYIEHEILRNMNEPRIHFAIVCASASCPKLLNEAYTPEQLDGQLTKATNEFLSDTTRNVITTNALKLSKIFKWFDTDFKQNGSVINFINQYTKTPIALDTDIDYLEYSWELNGN